MNIVIYLSLWAGIGLLAGFIAAWASSSNAWNWFWLNLAIGFLGAVGFGGIVTHALFGTRVMLSAYSLVFALLGAALSLLVLHFLKRRQK